VIQLIFRQDLCKLFVASGNKSDHNCSSGAEEIQLNVCGEVLIKMCVLCSSFDAETDTCTLQTMHVFCDVGFMTSQLQHLTSVLCIHPLWWHTISAIRRYSVHQSLKEKGLLLLISFKHVQ